MHEYSYNQIWIVQVWFSILTTVLKLLGSASSSTDVDNMCVSWCPYWTNVKAKAIMSATLNNMKQEKLCTLEQIALPTEW